MLDALGLLSVLRGQPMSAEQITDAIGVSRAKFFRLMRSMHEQLGVVIEHDPTVGGYRIRDWGVINQRRL